jgi:hypothetical protein
MMTDDEINTADFALAERKPNPFGGAAGGAVVAQSAGARQSQSRELAETQTKYLMAQQFPRDERKAMDVILNGFSRPGLAERSQYQFSRGGTDIAGPSIHAAQAMAQGWGNIEFGWRELSRGMGADGKPYSEVEAFAIDLQGRVPSRIAFIVPHWRDTKQGGYKLKDERDIYELCANQAQRRKRACILSVIPQDVIDSAMEQASVTLNARADTSPEAMHKMVEAFAPFGVTKEMVEKRIQRRLDAITPGQVVGLKRIYASLRDEMSEPREWFDMSETAAAASTGTPPPTSAVDAAKQALKARGKAGKVDPATGEIHGKATAPAPAGFDYVAAMQRIETSNDAEALAIYIDELSSTLPDCAERDALMEAYRKRVAALN